MVKVRLVIFCFSILFPFQVWAQASEIAQLALNIEKLAQFKSILSDLKKGYEIVSKGYGAIKDLTKGNFDIHKTFLDGLFAVSPAVKKYRKVGQIVDCQIRMVKYSKSALRRFQHTELLNTDEIKYLEHVFASLLEGSLRNLDQLITVVTAGKLRASDDERLRAIDGINEDMEQRLIFMRYFSDRTSLLIVQREQENADVKGSKYLQGIELQ